MSDVASDLSSLFDPDEPVSLHLNSTPFDLSQVVVSSITPGLTSSKGNVHATALDPVHGVRPAVPLDLVVEVPELTATWGPMDDFADTIETALACYNDTLVDPDTIPVALVRGECTRVVRSALRDWKRFRQGFFDVCRKATLACAYDQPFSDLEHLVRVWDETVESLRPHVGTVEAERDAHLNAVDNALRSVRTSIVAVARGGMSAVEKRRSVVKEFRTAHLEQHHASMLAFAAECRRLLNSKWSASAVPAELLKEKDALHAEVGVLNDQILTVFKPVAARISALVQEVMDAATADGKAPKWYSKWLNAGAFDGNPRSVDKLVGECRAILMRVRLFLAEQSGEPGATNTVAPSPVGDAIAEHVVELLTQLDTTYTNDWTGVEAAAKLAATRTQIRHELENLVASVADGVSPVALQPMTSCVRIVDAAVSKLNAANNQRLQTLAMYRQAAMQVETGVRKRKNAFVAQMLQDLDKMDLHLSTLDHERSKTLNGLAKQESTLKEAAGNVLDTLRDKARHLRSNEAEFVSSSATAMERYAAHADLVDAIEHLTLISSKAKGALLAARRVLSTPAQP